MSPRKSKNSGRSAMRQLSTRSGKPDAKRNNREHGTSHLLNLLQENLYLVALIHKKRSKKKREKKEKKERKEPSFWIFVVVSLLEGLQNHCLATNQNHFFQVEFWELDFFFCLSFFPFINGCDLLIFQNINNMAKVLPFFRFSSFLSSRYQKNFEKKKMI